MDLRVPTRRADSRAGVLLAFGASLTGCLAGPYASSSGPVDTGLADTDGTSTSTSTDPGTTGTTTSSSGAVTDDGTSTTAPPDSDTDTTTGAPARCGDGVLDDGEECDDGNTADDDACLSTCKLATCGDGIVQLGVEECDDGNTVDLDGCTNKCVIQICGDGIIQDGETCDDGDDDDTDECPTTCQNATCGDGFVWSGVEVCDTRGDDPLCDADCTLPVCGDGHTNASAGEECDEGGESTATCDADCTLPACGDGEVSPLAGEECDDGNDLSGDGCSATCLKERRVVFVTSTLYTGNLGGLAGADAKCQAHAQAAGLSGTFLAWLSDDQHTPASRFVKSTVPYVLPDGQQVAKNWNDLTDGVLQHAIDQTELKAPPPAATLCSNKPTVWTNTREDGTKWESGVCNNFTSTTGAGRLGTSAAINYTWSRGCSGAAGTCAWQAPIYCFEQ